MKRREFITLLGGAAMWPFAARAAIQGGANRRALHRPRRRGVVQEGTPEGLRELGYMEGQNIAFEFRSAEGNTGRLPALAAELVRLKVDMIVALYVPCALAAKQATQDIPIVIIAADPVETGIVASLARPDGNITGVSLMSAASNAKTVELFRDMLPWIRRVGVIGTAVSPEFAKAMVDEVLRAAGPTGTEIQPVVMIRGPDELESAFTTIERERADALVVQGVLAIKPLADMAIKYRMPTASTTRAFVDVGGLMSFGADGPATFRHGAKFVQRILQGKQPKDVPIEQPTKFELAINLKTAKAIGLAIPEAFLHRADVVLE